MPKSRSGPVKKPTTVTVPHDVSLLWIEDETGQLWAVKNNEPPIPVAWPDEDEEQDDA